VELPTGVVAVAKSAVDWQVSLKVCSHGNISAVSNAMLWTPAALAT
jgi:hypothetical protein